MDQHQLKELLAAVRDGRLELEEAAAKLRLLPFENIGDIAKIDHHRPLRTGTPEVVFGEQKTAEQIGLIMDRVAKTGGGALATRVNEDKGRAVVASLQQNWPKVTYHSIAGTVVIPRQRPVTGKCQIAVVSAGTSDLRVAEEAAITIEFLGFYVERVTDVGIAGLPRLIQECERFRDADAIVAVAGMEGALPAAICGLTERPVIAVPTSIGYGVGLGGYVAMMGMLASCSPGMLVVNIDNGFGAAMAAARIVRGYRGRA